MQRSASNKGRSGSAERNAQDDRGRRAALAPSGCSFGGCASVARSSPRAHSPLTTKPRFCAKPPPSQARGCVLTQKRGFCAALWGRRRPPAAGAPFWGSPRHFTALRRARLVSGGLAPASGDSAPRLLRQLCLDLRGQLLGDWLARQRPRRAARARKLARHRGRACLLAGRELFHGPVDSRNPAHDRRAKASRHPGSLPQAQHRLPVRPPALTSLSWAKPTVNRLSRHKLPPPTYKRFSALKNKRSRMQICGVKPVGFCQNRSVFDLV